MFWVKINTDSAAFDEDRTLEIARILGGVVGKMFNGGISGGDLLDANGNFVGEWGIE